jgi:hypothetical protein
MRPDDILQFVRRKPFQPFKITLTNGRSYEIHHPELAMVGRSTVVLGLMSSPHPELIFNRSVDVDLLHIMEAEHLPASPEANGPGSQPQ